MLKINSIRIKKIKKLYYASLCVYSSFTLKATLPKGIGSGYESLCGNIYTVTEDTLSDRQSWRLSLTRTQSINSDWVRVSWWMLFDDIMTEVTELA